MVLSPGFLNQYLTSLLVNIVFSTYIHVWKYLLVEIKNEIEGPRNSKLNIVDCIVNTSVQNTIKN